MMRLAVTDDARQIAQLHIESQRRTYMGIYTSDYLNSLDVSKYEKEWIEYICRRDCYTVVYEKEDNKHIVGFASVRFFDDGKYNASLDYLHVDKDAQGGRIGTNLMQVVFKLISLEQIDSLILYCTEDNNRARRFYQKLGAQYIGSELADNFSGIHFNNKLLIDNLRNKICEEISIPIENIHNYTIILDYMKQEYVLWGAGNYYNKFCEQFGDRYKPVCIFDNNSKLWGLTVNGVSIMKPQKTDLPIIIACASYNKIEKQAYDIGCEKIASFYPWHNYLKDWNEE